MKIRLRDRPSIIPQSVIYSPLYFYLRNPSLSWSCQIFWSVEFFTYYRKRLRFFVWPWEISVAIYGKIPFLCSFISFESWANWFVVPLQAGTSPVQNVWIRVHGPIFAPEPWYISLNSRWKLYCSAWPCPLCHREESLFFWNFLRKRNFKKGIF